MGLFDKFKKSIDETFKKGLEKTRTFVSESINKIAANMGYFDEDMLDELEMVLISADCGRECTEFLLDKIRDEIKTTGNNSVENVMQVLKDGMREVLGDPVRLDLQPGLNILLMTGVNGTGKTTTAGKLAYRYSRQGKKVILCAADTFRAAAIEQLEIWAERADAALIKTKTGGDPASVVYDAIQSAKANKADLLIVDTAGRLHTKKNLMAELQKIRNIVAKKAPEANVKSLLVIDATTGQNALVQAEAFNEAGGIDGLAITKLDGNAKGGITLSVCKESELPLYLAGLGEGIEDLADFDPDLFIDSLLPDPSEFSSNKNGEVDEAEDAKADSEE